MNKLTKQKTLYVPVSLDEILPDWIDDIYTLTQEGRNEGLVKELNNKYIFSEEELVLFKRQWALEVLNKAKNTDINTVWHNIKRELHSEFEKNNT